MADEPIKPNSPVDTAALMAEVESLRKSNREILDDYKKAKEAARAVPPDVDVDALIAYKQKKEQEELEMAMAAPIPGSEKLPWNTDRTGKRIPKPNKKGGRVRGYSSGGKVHRAGLARRRRS